jgi:hypothetical protein
VVGAETVEVGGDGLEYLDVHIDHCEVAPIRTRRCGLLSDGGGRADDQYRVVVESEAVANVRGRGSIRACMGFYVKVMNRGYLGAERSSSEL